MQPAPAERDVHELIRQRQSIYAFADQPIARADLLALFEAARWAPSSYNEQPWSFLVATRENEEEFQRMTSCLVEANQAWAKHSAALALAIAELRFRRNQNDNAHALHDVGLATAQLITEATARGIAVHVMAGIDAGRAATTYAVPKSHRVITAMALGYPSNEGEFAARDRGARQRRPLNEMLFRGRFGEPLRE